MAISKNIQDDYEQELTSFPPAVVSQYRTSARLLAGILREDDFRSWATEGISIARHSFRSWEAGAEYFRVTPQVLAKLPFPNFMEWAGWGKVLAKESAVLSTTFFHSSPEALAHLTPHQIGDWVSLGKGLYKGTWKSGTLSSRFFETSPSLLRYMTLGEFRRFVTFLDALSRRSYDLANECLASAEPVFRSMEKQDRRGFLSPGLQYGGTQLAGCEGLLRVWGRDPGPDRPGAARPLPRPGRPVRQKGRNPHPELPCGGIKGSRGG